MRREARELALQVLFQTEFSQQVPYSHVLDLLGQSLDKSGHDFADELVSGVQANKSAIDSAIASASRHWKVERMATIDRNILRIAVYEMKFSKSPIKENIVINEAIEIAKKFGTNESASFVNGLLDQIAKSKS